MPQPHKKWLRDDLRGKRGAGVFQGLLDSACEKLTEQEADAMRTTIRHMLDDAKRDGQRQAARQPGRFFRG